MVSLCAVLCLYGCGARQLQTVTQQQVLSNLSQPITAQLAVTTPELSFEGRLERTGPEVYSFQVSSPEQLEGLCIAARQQSCTLSYGGMEIELSAEPLPLSFGVVALNRGIDELLRQQEPNFQTTADGGAVLDGSLEGQNFSLEFNSSGQPILFTLPEYDLTIVIQPNEPFQ